MMTGWKKIVFLAALAGGSVSAAPIRDTGTGRCGGEARIEADKLIPVEYAEMSTLPWTMSRKGEDSDEQEFSQTHDPEQDASVGSEPSFPGMQ